MQGYNYYGGEGGVSKGLAITFGILAVILFITTCVFLCLWLFGAASPISLSTSDSSTSSASASSFKCPRCASFRARRFGGRH